MFKRSHALIASAALISSVLLTGCGGNDATGASAGPAAPKADSLAASVPKAIADKGVLTFGSDMTYPPFEMLSPSKEPMGFDIDLATAVAQTLGLKAKFVQNGFDALPTSLKAGRFDLVISAMTDAADRREVVDFVDYVKVQGGVMVRADDASAPGSFDALCGHTVAAQRGSDQVKQAQAKKAKCETDGEKPLSLKVYPSAPEQALALKSQRVDAALYDTVTGGYTAKQSGGAFKMGEPYGDPVINGIAVAKTNEDLRTAVQKALQKLMDDGTYQKLLAKWGMEQSAIDKATVNEGGLGS